MAVPIGTAGTRPADDAQVEVVARVEQRPAADPVETEPETGAPEAQRTERAGSGTLLESALLARLAERQGATESEAPVMRAELPDAPAEAPDRVRSAPLVSADEAADILGVPREPRAGAAVEASDRTGGVGGGKIEEAVAIAKNVKGIYDRLQELKGKFG